MERGPAWIGNGNEHGLTTPLKSPYHNIHRTPEFVKVAKFKNFKIFKVSQN